MKRVKNSLFRIIWKSHPSKILKTTLVPNLWLLSILEVNLAKEGAFSNIHKPRTLGIILLTPVCSEHWLLYCLKYNRTLKIPLKGFSLVLNMLVFFKSKTSEGGYQLWMWALWLILLDAKKLVFISSFLSLFLAVITKKLRPGWMGGYVALLELLPALLVLGSSLHFWEDISCQVLWPN